MFAQQNSYWQHIFTEHSKGQRAVSLKYVLVIEDNTVNVRI